MFGDRNYQIRIKNLQNRFLLNVSHYCALNRVIIVCAYPGLEGSELLLLLWSGNDRKRRLCL